MKKFWSDIEYIMKVLLFKGFDIFNSCRIGRNMLISRIFNLLVLFIQRRRIMKSSNYFQSAQTSMHIILEYFPKLYWSMEYWSGIVLFEYVEN